MQRVMTPDADGDDVPRRAAAAVLDLDDVMPHEPPFPRVAAEAALSREPQLDASHRETHRRAIPFAWTLERDVGELPQQRHPIDTEIARHHVEVIEHAFFGPTGDVCHRSTFWSTTR